MGYMRSKIVDAINYTRAMLKTLKNEINALSYEMIGKIIYIILRSNGKKVDEEEAMILIPGDVDEIENIFNEFFKKMEEFKKKEESKRQMREMMKKA